MSQRFHLMLQKEDLYYGDLKAETENQITDHFVPKTTLYNCAACAQTSQDDLFYIFKCIVVKTSANEVS